MIDILHIIKSINPEGWSHAYCGHKLDSDYDNFITINNLNEISKLDFNRLYCPICFNELILTKEKLEKGVNNE